MEDIFIDLGDDLGITPDSGAIIGEDNLLSESEALVGPQGPPGPQGPKGDAGRDGHDGRNATIEIGTTTTGQPGTNASVVNSGTESQAVLNFTIPRGEQGIQGIQGDPGEDGEDGAAATISVGSVTTVAPEYPATVTNSGTTSAAILDFQIPQGIQGEQGVPGQDGQDGQDGAPGQAATIAVGTTSTGAAGTNASVTNSGTSSAAVFNFTIPRGADGQNGQDGQDGQDGAPGQAATISVGSTTTGNAGTNASVTNSGTSSAAVLDFVIPRGADGQNGSNGADGVTPSITASATVDSNTGTPAVSVTKSGTDANPNFAFAFSNLKGETGPAPASNTYPHVIRNGWSSSITFTMDSGTHALVFMSDGWAGFIYYSSGYGFSLKSIYNAQYPPSMTSSGNSVTLSANANKTWTVFKNVI